jgi:hypothetical protein
MVNVILTLLGPAFFAVMTWITPIRLKCKVILEKIDHGERMAMGPRTAQMSPGDGR